MSSGTENQELSSDAQRLLERIAEAFGSESVPDAFAAYGQQEVFLKDLMMNLKKFVAGDGSLEQKTRLLIALATAAHAKSDVWTSWLSQIATQKEIDRQTQIDSLAVASTNYMYNTFFKFRHLSGSDRFEGLSVGLRAHTFSGTSLDDATVELINIAISDLNACPPCVSGHVAKAKKLDLSDEQILEAVQCASTVYAGCQFLSSAGMLP